MNPFAGYSGPTPPSETQALHSLCITLLYEEWIAQIHKIAACSFFASLVRAGTGCSVSRQRGAYFPARPKRM